MLGVTVDYQSLNIDAILHENESGYLALLNSATPKTRQRFSLAHELGHVMLHKATGLSQAFGHLSTRERRSSEGSEIEDLCDLFAAELLMPLEDWKQHVSDNGVSLKVIRELMNQYDVSMSAASRRVIEVSTWKCLIVTWEPIYEEEVLTELKTAGCWDSISPGKYEWPNSIPNRVEFCIPGSPLYAVENGRETLGTIPFPFTMKNTRYVAQSDLFITQRARRVATVMIPASYGWPVILRSNKGNSNLPVQALEQRQLEF